MRWVVKLACVLCELGRVVGFCVAGTRLGFRGVGFRLGFRGVGFHVGMGLGFVDDGVELGVDVFNVITKSFCVVGKYV